MIKAVCFDADGVVQRTPSTFRASLVELAGDADKADEFLAEVFAAERPCLTGEREFAPMLQTVLRRWKSPVNVEQALLIWTLIEPVEETFAVVERIRSSGVHVALASNQQSHRAGIMTTQLGYAGRFDQLFYSCELGVAKPDPAYFESLLMRLEMPGDEVLFVDDHESNVRAAREVGLNAETFHVDSGSRALVSLLRRHGVHVSSR